MEEVQEEVEAIGQEADDYESTTSRLLARTPTGSSVGWLARADIQVV